MKNKIYEKIIIRFFVESKDEKTAKEIANKLGQKLSEKGKVHTGSIGRYWKIPEYFEVSMEVNLEKTEYENLSLLSRFLGDGWEYVNENSVVWDNSDKGDFVVKQVKWAELERVTE